MGMGMGGNGKRDVGKMVMVMRYWNGNGNGMGMGMLPREWEGIGTTIVILAHLYRRAVTSKVYLQRTRYSKQHETTE